jgi:hypothetical protein
MTDRAPILFTNHVMHGEYRSVISSELPAMVFLLGDRFVQIVSKSQNICMLKFQLNLIYLINIIVTISHSSTMRHKEKCVENVIL